jgi:hypothetical protein
MSDTTTNPMPAPNEVRIERLERAVDTMAAWLVQAQTGFAERDYRGIAAILRGDDVEGDAG